MCVYSCVFVDEARRIDSRLPVLKRYTLAAWGLGSTVRM